MKKRRLPWWKLWEDGKEQGELGPSACGSLDIYYGASRHGSVAFVLAKDVYFKSGMPMFFIMLGF